MATSFQVPSDTCCHIETLFLRVLLVLSTTYISHHVIKQVSCQRHFKPNLHLTGVRILYLIIETIILYILETDNKKGLSALRRGRHFNNISQFLGTDIQGAIPVGSILRQTHFSRVRISVSGAPLVPEIITQCLQMSTSTLPAYCAMVPFSSFCFGPGRACRNGPARRAVSRARRNSCADRPQNGTAWLAEARRR